MQNYLLVTPVKNEEHSLPNLISSVTKQSIKPVIWVIVNDGSTDNTEAIINQAKKRHNWIHTITLPETQRDIGFHYTVVCQRGFEEAINYAQNNNIKYTYIALLDADMNLENNYFEYLIHQMDTESKLGITSGWILSKVNEKYVAENQNTNQPSGGARIWKSQCFSETKGYETVMSPDSVSNARAILGGWQIKRFKEVRAFQSRETSSAEGLWKGYTRNGEHAYHLHFHFISTIGKAFNYAIHGEIQRGAAYFYGYTKACFNRTRRISDSDLIQFFKTKSLKALIGDQP
jgi:glycosyltransferase involved in cell wall biosynthesis